MNKNIVQTLTPIVKDMSWLLDLFKLKGIGMSKTYIDKDLIELRDNIKKLQLQKWRCEFMINWYSRKEELPSHYIKQ